MRLPHTPNLWNRFLARLQIQLDMRLSYPSGHAVLHFSSHTGAKAVALLSKRRCEEIETKQRVTALQQQGTHALHGVTLFTVEDTSCCRAF